MVAFAAVSQAAVQVDATRAAQHRASWARRTALALFAALAGTARVAAGPAVARIVGGIQAFIAAFGVAGVARKVTAAIAQRFAMGWCRTVMSATSAIRDVVLRVDARLLAK